MAQLDRFRPWMCALTLTTFQFIKLGYDPTAGVDNYFHARAKKDKKTLGALEPVDQLFTTFSKLDREKQELFLKHSISELDTIEKIAPELIKAWKAGNAKELQSTLKDSFKGFAELYKLLIIERNKSWVAKIEKEFVKQEGDVLIIVGVFHLVGKDSMIAMLKKKGYKVKQR